MTKHHARAARREREAAAVLGTTRVHRGRYERAPDLVPVMLPCGITLAIEVKNRAALPALLRGALQQAASYLPPPAVPAVVFSETGKTAHVCLPLAAFAVIAGLRAADNDPQMMLMLAAREGT